ncbi:MAG: hypothetical protein IT211_01405 [Armatimonadetes bacterium]|nr:hypothetical protein [Armatimonadota bacterium]
MNAMKTVAGLGIALIGLTLSASAQTPFSSIKLQQGGGTNPSNGLIMQSNPGDYVTGSGGNATMRFARPSGTGVLKGITFGSGILDVAVGAVNLASNGAGGDVTGTLNVSNGGTGLSTAPTNGQLLIGNGTGYTLGTITAGTGVTVTNGAGSITIAANIANTINSRRFALTDGQDVYTGVAAPTGFTLAAGSVVTITIQNGTDQTQYWATVTGVNTGANTMDFVLNGLPPANCTANIICMNP